MSRSNPGAITPQRISSVLQTLITRRLALTFDKVDFEYRDLSFRRLKNWFMGELSYLLKLEKTWSMPMLMQVEPSNICNLRCPLCHVVTDHKSRGLLRVDDFKRLMDEVADDLFFLHFWGWGEPFLNDDIYEMIRYAKGKGLKIISSTNGHCFEKPENIERLIDSNLDVLIVALDGVDQKTYELYRHQGDFQKVLNGLTQLIKRRNERDAVYPRINLRMLVTRENEDQVPAMKKLAQELGVDLFSLKTLCSFDKPDLWNTMVPSNPEYRRFEYDANGQPIQIKNRCKKAWNHPVVYRDGLVVPCDYYTGEEFSLGYAFHLDDPAGTPSQFKKVWMGNVFQSFRRQFKDEEKLELRCSECSLNFAYVDRCVSHAFTRLAEVHEPQG